MSPIVTTMSSPLGRIRRVKGSSSGGDTVVSAQMWRWDGNTGTVRVSAGIPLKPGMVTASNLNTVKLFVGGVEQAIAVTPMRGQFPDESYRSVGVQTVQSLTNNTPVDCELRIGATARGTTDLSWQEPVYDSGSATVACAVNRAMIAVVESQYLCDTFVALTPLQPEANDVSGTSKDFFNTENVGNYSLGGVWADQNANRPLAAIGAGTTYEHVHSAWAAYIRATSTATKRMYYQSALDTLIRQMGESTELSYTLRIGANVDAYASVYRGVDASLPAATDVNDPGLFAEWHTGMFVGWTTGYFLSAWKQPWRRLAHVQSAETGFFTSYATSDGMVDNTPRFNMQRRFQALLCAYVAHATLQVSGGYGGGRNNDTVSYADQIPWMLDRLDAEMYTTANWGAYMNGVVGQKRTFVDTAGPGEFPAFQAFVIAKTLIFLYHNVLNDSRIPTRVQALADMLITQMYLDSGSGLHGNPYIHQFPPITSGMKNAEDLYYPPIYSEVFAFTYAVTGNPTYKTWAERCARVAQFADHPSGPFARSTKFVGEHYSGQHQSAKYYIDGGAVRPVSGAHPTSVVNPPTYTS